MSNLATPWPATLPALPGLLDAATQELQHRRAAYSAAVRDGKMTRDEARSGYDAQRAVVHLLTAELRRGQPWPMLSPTPDRFLDWLARKTRHAISQQHELDIPFYTVMRWLVVADLDTRLPMDPADWVQMSVATG